MKIRPSFVRARVSDVRSHGHIVAGAVLFAVFAFGATPSLAKKKLPTTPCREGRFLVDGPPLAIRASTTHLDAIVISAGRIGLGQCGGSVNLRATKRGTTKLTAAVSRCPGVKGKVKVSGTLDTACGTVSGRIKAKKSGKTSFTARRSSCGDQRVDPGAGEQCEGSAGCDAGQQCDAATCQCGTPGGNRKPVASSMSMTVDPALAFGEQQLVATDPDGDTLEYELVSPERGAGYEQAYVNPRLGRFYLTVASGFTGHMDLTYRVSDGQQFSDNAELSIQVA